MKHRRIDFSAAVSLVVANMVGTGVFTGLGFQLLDHSQAFTIMALWFIGGIMALLGAVCYAELATRLPQDGGEYHFLSKVYHPALGFMAGFVSATVGFSAPIALAAASLGTYAHGVFDSLEPASVGTVVILGIAAIHATNLSAGMQFQKIFTLIKILLIAVFVIAGIFHGNTQGISFAFGENSSAEIMTAGFALNLVYVSYAYSGWNASTYLAGEIQQPEKNINRSIIWGTLLVMLLYVSLNAVFIASAPMPEMMVETEGPLKFQPKDVGIVSAGYIFGTWGGKVMGGVICLLLVSTISAMIIAGPRVIQPMFGKISALKPLSVTTEKGNPVAAIVFQTLLALIILWTASFEDIMQYIGFTLTLFTTLTVAGVIVYRIKYGKPEGYRALGYPFSPIIFIAANLWVCYSQVTDKTTQSIIGLATALAGVMLYFISTDKNNAQVSYE
ncbi:MAG: amino acid permease [Bacteroidetes bacterium]|nr:amino acid permease [Bacteroidota bacterium]